MLADVQQQLSTPLLLEEGQSRLGKRALRRQQSALKQQQQQHRALLPRELLCLLVLSVFICVPALAFYALSVGTWTFGEAVYFIIVTLTTVGYGDFIPKYGCSTSKVLIIFLVWWNALMTVSIMETFGRAVAGRLRFVGRHLGAKRFGVTAELVIAMLLLFLMLAVPFYFYEEDRSLADAALFAVISLTTIGDGFLTPSAFKILAGPLLLLGVACWAELGNSLLESFHMRFHHRYKSRSHRSSFSAAFVGMSLAGVGLALYTVTSQGWSLLECCYFTAVTLTTVGFGDYHPYGAKEELGIIVVLICMMVSILPVLLQAVGSGVLQVSEDIVLYALRQLAAAPEEIKGILGFSIKLAGSEDTIKHYVHCWLLGALILGGAVVFAWVESWTLLEGVYFASVTLTTVGYGDMTPTSHTSRWLATIYILVGVPTAACLVSSLSSKYTSGMKRFLCQHSF
mmetsp:Transcript_64833/g.154783  ORF Transcript_64833/g.154783 Transcript_64833/m.154783 type:complete len:455 (+) Transcript_64833:290-1654(+)